MPAITQSYAYGKLSSSMLFSTSARQQIPTKSIPPNNGCLGAAMIFAWYATSRDTIPTISVARQSSPLRRESGSAHSQAKAPDISNVSSIVIA